MLAGSGKNALPSVRIVRRSDDEFAGVLPCWVFVDFHSENFNGIGLLALLRQGVGFLIGGQFAE
jgi:hypothetical protein